MAPGLRIPATGRRSLGLPSEEVLTPEPLPVPDEGAATVDEAMADAVVLLADRAAEAVPGFAVTHCEKQARRLLGDDAFQRAFDAGYSTDPDVGVTSALTPPGPSPHAPAQPGPAT